VKYTGIVYKYCAGYQYNDPTIVGFSHAHFSGTSHSDLGDFLIMPTTGKLQLNPGTEGHSENGYQFKFFHNNELAEPNYYKVKLDDHHIMAELTTTTRVGYHQYTFPKSDQAHIILDLMHVIYNFDEKNVWTFVRVENDSTVVGYRQTNGWARTRTVYFAMKFSKSYGAKDFSPKVPYRGFWGKFDQTKNFPDLAGKQLRMYFDFDTQEGEKIDVKFALSSVSTKNALENMQVETPNWNFNEVKAKGRGQWQKEFERVQVNMISKTDMVNFYTAMYHAFVRPTVYTDVNGQYKGLDQNVHQVDGFTNYTSFSLWDTYRALHPLFNILQPARNNDVVKSMMTY
jgi:predicted alpha-1,2-mannosidase